MPVKIWQPIFRFWFLFYIFIKLKESLYFTDLGTCVMRNLRKVERTNTNSSTYGTSSKYLHISEKNALAETALNISRNHVKRELLVLKYCNFVKNITIFISSKMSKSKLHKERTVKKNLVKSNCVKE